MRVVTNKRIAIRRTLETLDAKEAIEAVIEYYFKIFEKESKEGRSYRVETWKV